MAAIGCLCKPSESGAISGPRRSHIRGSVKLRCIRPFGGIFFRSRSAGAGRRGPFGHRASWRRWNLRPVQVCARGDRPSGRCVDERIRLASYSAANRRGGGSGWNRRGTISSRRCGHRHTNGRSSSLARRSPEAASRASRPLRGRVWRECDGGKREASANEISGEPQLRSHSQILRSSPDFPRVRESSRIYRRENGPSPRNGGYDAGRCRRLNLNRRNRHAMESQEC